VVVAETKSYTESTSYSLKEIKKQPGNVW